MTSESKAHTDFQNKSLKTDEQEDGFDSYCYECKSILKETAVCPGCGQGYEWVSDGECATLEKKGGKNPKTAVDFLKEGISILGRCGDERGAPKGEETMKFTAKAFSVVTGIDITTEQGHLFMVLHKMVRSQQGPYHQDNYIDGQNYFALAGEAACRDRK